MNIVPITPENPLCMGVCCHLHGTCARYLNVDGSKPEDFKVVDCGPEYTLYIPALPVLEGQGVA